MVLAILYLAVLVLSAKAFEEVMVKIKQPPILGNVLAGIIVGPALLSIVQPVDEIELFISIGVFFLFFLIGLEEIDLPGLFGILRRRMFLASAVGFFVPFVVATMFSSYIGYEFVKAFAIASVIGASSLGVAAKVLMDLGRLRTTIGLEIFTVTAMVEFIAIIFASVMIQIGATQVPPNEFDLVWLFARMIIFFALAGLFGKYVLPHMLNSIRKYMKVKEIYFGTVIGIMLLVAYFAEVSGVHGAIGALLFGIAVSQMPRAEYFETVRGLHSIGHGIFIPIFFAGIGLHFLPTFFQLPILIIGGFLAIIIGVKFAGSYLAARVARLTPTTTVASGVMAKGAIDLALMLSLLTVGLVDESLFSLLVFGTLIMMVLSSAILQRGLGLRVEVKGEPREALIPLYVKLAMSDSTAKDAMSVTLPHVDKDTTISQFVAEHLDEGKATYLVLDSRNLLLGAVSIREINKVPQKQWSMTKLEEVMEKNVTVAREDEDLFSVIEKMNRHNYELIPIVDALDVRKVTGVISRHDIMQLLVKQPDEMKG
ncbi:MAG: cation:proton antiporter [Nitrososphaerales archaeon]